MRTHINAMINSSRGEAGEFGGPDRPLPEPVPACAPVALSNVAVELWAEYVKRVTPGMTQADIAAAADIDQTGVSRWLNGRTVPRMESVTRFARALGRSPVEALAAAGYITLEEAGLKPDLVISIRELATDDLVAEIRRRILDR